MKRAIPKKSLWITAMILWPAAPLLADEKPTPANEKTAAPAQDPLAGLISPENLKRFEEEFEKTLWPLLNEGGEKSCVGCHDNENPSDLHFFPNLQSSFRMLLTGNFLNAENPSSLLARITAPKEDVRMPPEAPAWPAEKTNVIRQFVTELFEVVQSDGPPADERFPMALLMPFEGPDLGKKLDNTFLTYRQLQGKIESVFQQRWRRGGRDLFHENLAMFGGADFHRRFSESNEPSASFLVATENLARDLASSAYLNATGPFEARYDRLPSPLQTGAPLDDLYREQIANVFQRVLYRQPTAEEVDRAFGFLKSVYQKANAIRDEGFDLTFELTVSDETGLSTKRDFTISVSNGELGLRQTWIDQSTPEDPGKTGRKTLPGYFTLRAGDERQRLRISNEDSHGNVSAAGVEIRGPIPAETVQTITAKDAGVQVKGAWQPNGGEGFTSYDDGNTNKGQSEVEFPLTVKEDGVYELRVLWRAGDAKDMANTVLVETFSHDPTALATRDPDPIPPAGEAHYRIDQTRDNIAFWDLPGAFRFVSAGDGVEINNADTRSQVVADAVKFTLRRSDSSFLVDNPEADGQDTWQPFTKFAFRPYNKTGKDTLTDDNQKKGELKLLYRPSVKEAEWKADCFYRVGVGFPGQAKNETRTPVIVRATESSPIVQWTYPKRARVGTTVRLDAGHSYNTQHTPLQFAWRQIGGPRMDLDDPNQAAATFIVTAKSPEQEAWEGFCRALLMHPDFLFTRPTSLANDALPTGDKQRLQAVKIAMDLVGRNPTDAELAMLQAGTSIEGLIDHYLQTQEFQDFYLHRTRLYLESHGTESQDEPVRLWCYVAFNDLPFQEILTADYTVNASFEKVARPAHHGKTGLLTMKGFIEGKPGLPHFNYAAAVAEKFLGYVFEVPPEIVQQRDAITAASTTNPTTVCYSCHKILTPLAYQRLRWNDKGEYVEKEKDGKLIDDSDQKLVPSYPYKGQGMEAFAVQAQNKERFVRTMINTHYIYYFGREMRSDQDERDLYKQIWDRLHEDHFTIRGLIKSIMTSAAYLNG
jgi:hypothetical protein